MQHCLRVRTPDPYEVPKLFATSLAPMAKDRRNDIGSEARKSGRRVGTEAASIACG